MDDDDLMPNDNTYFTVTEPQDQVIARRKEKAHTLEALPVLRAVIERLDERIAFYGSVDSIPDEVKSKPEEFLVIHNANQLVRDNLRAERNYLQGLIDDYAK